MAPPSADSVRGARRMRLQGRGALPRAPMAASKEAPREASGSGPRARPGTLEEKYQMRTVHYGETAQRIAEAKLILITGATTAVGMAVALKKPIVMIKADGRDISEQVRDEALVDILKLHVWDQDLDTSARSFFNIDAERYDRFVEKFVKTRGSTKALFWQAVLDSLQNRKLPSTRRL